MTAPLVRLSLKLVRTTDNSRRVERAVRRQMDSTLRTLAAYVRRSAKDSLRKRRRPSRPGQPPTAWTPFLRSGLRFARERYGERYLVGALPSRNRSNRTARALEFGGRSRRTKTVKGRRVRYSSSIQPRPFLRPALAKNAKKIPSLIRKFEPRGV